MGNEAKKRFFLVRSENETVLQTVAKPSRYSRITSANGYISAINREANVTARRIADLKEREHDLGSKKKHGRLISKSELNEGRKGIRRSINAEKAKLEILEGNRLGEIQIGHEEGGLHTVVGVREFNQGEGFWWNQVEKDKSLEELRTNNPESFSLVQSAVTLRIRSETNPEDKRPYFETLDKLSEDPIADTWTVRLIDRYRNN